MVQYIRSDLEFILEQIRIAERHANGEQLTDLIPNTEIPLGLRTVDGTFNNLIAGQTGFGAADNTFPRLVDPNFLPGYDATSGLVIDSAPRTISNLIVDQTVANPAAYARAYDVGVDGILGTADDVLKAGVTIVNSPGPDLIDGTADDRPVFQFNNVAPDEGLSAPFNAWMTFFGQFFDHGLDLVTKGGSGTVFIPLQPDDPLWNPAPGAPNFLVLTRATNQPGLDGVLGTADDVHEAQNTTSPFVDQNQTYSSHPSHQVFLRAYELRLVDDGVNPPHQEAFATGGLIEGANGGMATWAEVKAQARDILGIDLTDANLSDVPLLATDPYGNFIRGANGFVQVVFPGNVLVEGNPAAPISLAGAIGTGHAFLNDIAHAADPSGGKIADSDGVIGITNPNEFPNPDYDAGAPPGSPNSRQFLPQYDNELLDKHYIAGDGRVNENIGLTAVHQIFHSEHNRLLQQTKDVAIATGDVAFLNEWLMPNAQLTVFPPDQAAIDALQWNGERLFQSAKFGTEMQYQHLVFEEFARTIQPNVDAFLDFNGDLNPAIFAEFAHTVYRFGHSMLTETIDRLDANFDNNPIGLVQSFLNPLAFAASGATPEDAAAAIIRGLTRQVGNEIDEFVTEALRNNLLGLPLDLAAINLARGRDTGIPSLNEARREFFNGTGDSQLKPYDSWVDFAQHIKNPESLINFVAAYGTHAELLAADVNTLAEKRAVALALVLGGSAVINEGELDERIFVADDIDRLDFLHSQGTYVRTPTGVTTTGVDAIDLWIGGLAEEKMPFGGMLGSTFNFVFETQLEALQDGDRFYYLHRLGGTNFVAELENNSFSSIVMKNTGLTHLPALIFSTPGLTLEVDILNQFNAHVANNPGLDGILGTADDVATPFEDPNGESALLTPLVIRDNPDTVGADTNYLQYTGDEHVVLGGTAGNDILIASIGDDTVYGDGGNDRIEGGYGNDDLQGGAGDDIITDAGGDDVIKGGDGNDVIQGGNGLNLIIAGRGSDFIITGEDSSEVIAGEGNDFILGTKMNVQMAGNEGNDWIEIGTQDGAPGDNFNPFGDDLIKGDDVFLGDGSFDEMIGEGGDDIMVGSGGPDKFKGMSGYDWATFKDDRFGANVDLFGDAFNEAPLPASGAAVMNRFRDIEGLSGSSHSDVLRGDNADTAVISTAGAQGSVLTNIALIDGLQQFLDTAFGTSVTSFAAGNIILGGSGSDVIEGRGGDDLIDGDKWLNVRVSVRSASDHNMEIDSVDRIADLVPRMLSGEINPSQLEIVREIKDGVGFNFDTAVFSGNQGEYTVTTIDDRGTVDTRDDILLVTDSVAGRDGSDRLVGIERLQFSDGSVTLAAGLNDDPIGLLTISDTTPASGQVLTASTLGITDADNVSGSNPTGAVTGPVAVYWQAETVAGSGVFQDILAVGAGVPVASPTLRVDGGLEGLALRVRAVYQDGHGVLENVFSDPTDAVAVGVPPPPPAPTPDMTVTATSDGIRFIRSDLQFILDQIKIAEQHADGADLHSLLPNGRVSQGLRTVDGTFNNLVQGQSGFGAADQPFPRISPAQFLPGYNATSGLVIDSAPRTISNLIVDQTAANPAAYARAYDAGVDGILHTGDDVLKDGVSIVTSPGPDLLFGTGDDRPVFQFNNVAPDEGLSAPFNAWMTFFGQFFDHGLDLVTKGGSGTVFIPLQTDDPLWNPAPGAPNFLVLTRATNGPGVDGILGTADDVHEAQNTTSPFVDQNQTYSSHPSHQVFLRAYELRLVDDGVNPPHEEAFNTGGLIQGANGGMATWAEVKAQANNILGINLTDANLFDVPLLATDQYGNFIKGPNGFVQVVMKGLDGIAGTADDVLVEGNPLAPISLVGAVGTGHAFLNDIAHAADPSGGKTADIDILVGNNDGISTTYDDELLDNHYIAGDGRVNENIGLTAVHQIFHSEHNRLVEHTKAVLLATAETGDVSFINEWLLVTVTEIPADLGELQWNGERLFQAAKFGTEMQYQHLVFEEFARTIQPQIDIFMGPTQNYDAFINPAIFAEFAHTVYRFGHSMLTESIDRLDANFNNSEIGLVQSFLNPLEFAAGGTAEEAAGAIIRGLTRQVGNEIDEFVTEALRNNLLGLPLDLATLNLARGRDTGVASLNTLRRDIYNQTGDSNLKPYTSWADFVQHIKHPESLINFIAAYGTHASITGATTLAGKREAATLLVFGDSAGVDGIFGTADDVIAPADRFQFLNSQGIYANVAGVTTTGVDAIDLWIGGLAEEKMPFGGMLGSTFNFVFENQLEALQNGDRFYYLDRTSGLNFGTELESNSFARLIMANTNVHHLPGLVFSTPAFTLEVDQSLQFNAHTGVFLPGVDGVLGDDITTLLVDESLDDVENTNADPESGDPLFPWVIRDNPNTPLADTNYLQYTGDEHVVLGGTEGDDIMIASIGDDTIWGDGGNDIIDGGYGNDMIRSGAGDDIVTDIGGDDNIQGGDGNDVLHGGNGLNLILGGAGQDFIISGEDSNETFGGAGNDFILGSTRDEQNMGNEGNDWIESGSSDGSPGDNFDPNGLDLIAGHDVYIGDSMPNIMNAEGGDDIMVGSSGAGDKYLGASGFDWATFKDDPLGVNIDLTIDAFNTVPIAPSAANILARFAQVEGLSGSRNADLLRGDNEDALSLPNAGAQGSVLTNISLINGLQALLDNALGAGTTSFGSGNIILGGDGSDVIEGRGGDDLIDGDKWLNVRVSVRDPLDHSMEIDSVDRIAELVPRMLSGEINPGQLEIVREIKDGTPLAFNFDTAVFSGLRSEYSIVVDDRTTPLDFSDDLVTVTDNVLGRDGIDRLAHIERLQFADESVTLVPGLNSDPAGLLLILDNISGLEDNTPTEGQTLRVSSADITDPDNVTGLNPTGAVDGITNFVWQVELAAGSGVFTDILTVNGAGEVLATGATFTPGPDLAGLALRVRASFFDAHGVIEQAFSAPTAPVVNINDLPIGTVIINDMTPAEDQILIASNAFTDADGLTAAVFTYQWQQLDGLDWVDIPTGILPNFLPEQAQVGHQLRVVVTYTDDQGTTETVTSAETAAVANVNDLPVGSAFFELTPQKNIAIAATEGFFDEDGITPGALTYQWQVSDGIGGWTDIVGAINMNFVPTTTELGLELRVVITYLDDFGTLETVISDPSLPVINLNDPATGTVLISDTTPTEGQLLTTTNAIVDTDGLVGVVFNYQWEQFDGLDWNPILGANASSFLPTQTQVNHELRVVVSFIDNGGAIETITSDPTIVTGDFIVGLNVAEVLGGTEGQDIINGNGGADIIDGLGQNDILDGGAGDDIINGGAGDDVINGGADDDIINGDAGNDTINFTLGDEDDTIDGGADTDTLNFVGGAGNETLNVIYDGASITEFQNGTVANVEVLNANLGGGVDTLSYNPPGGRITTANVAVNLALGTATGFASIVGIENATGGSGNDTFAGNTSANTFDGGNGNDTFTGDLGNDTLIGGLGVDTYNLSANAAAATITSTSATSAAIGNDTLSGIENINGSSVADTITMGAGNNVINGNGGGDIINGGAGADIINGDGGNDTINYNVGDGADTVNGGAGASDRLNIIGSAAGETIGVVFNGVSISSVAGGAISNVEIVNIDLAGGNDTLSFAASTANVTANLTTGVGSGIALLAGIENLTGGTGDDTFTGNTFANVLNGGGGNDRFVATVNDGDDTYTGGAGTDTLDLSGTTAGASVTAGAATSAQIGNDTLNAIENVNGSQGNDIINFGGGANVIDGRGGADTINAGGGADTITGGAGNDTMNGGAGNDTFIFATGFGLDTIQGFDALPGGGGQDRLFLDSSLGINAGNFALSVSIAGLAGNTVITIGAEQITLLGVAAATVDINDFQFGP